MQKIFTEILIIGAGPAGGMCAKLLTEGGAKVILLEKKEKIGAPLQCAEYVPWQIQRECSFIKDVVSQSINFMVTYLEWKEIGRMKVGGFTIDRERFEAYILHEAERAGAKIFLRQKVIGFEDGVFYSEDGLKVKPEIVICADGAKSTGRRWIGKKGKYINALQYRLKLAHPLEDTLIFFSEEIPGGYGWVFPKGNVANVGVGIDKSFRRNPKEVLDNFLKKIQDIVEINPLEVHAGLVPIQGMDVLFHGALFFIGDAAGMAHPVTGAGICNAIQAATLLAECILRGGNIAGNYEKECHEVFGSAFERAIKKRELFLSVWKEGKELSKILEKVWIGFGGYYG